MPDNSIDEVRQKIQELGEAGLLEEDTGYDARAKRQAVRGIAEAFLIIALGVAIALAAPHLMTYIEHRQAIQTTT